METKANFTLIGIFTLGFIAFMVVFLLWMTGVGFQEQPKTYHIFFSSVSGLKEGSTVNYQGVLVGNVSSIMINPKKIHEIKVTVTLNPSVPIKKDTYATIQNQGITGTSIIQLSGGSQDAEDLEKEYDQEYPVIKSRSSQLDQVIESAPELIGQISKVAKDINEVVSEGNRSSLEDILDNVKDFTDSLTDPRGGSIMVEITDTLKQAKVTLKSMEEALHDLKAILAENRQSIKNFSGTGLAAMTKFFDEGTETLATFKRIGEQIERSPMRFFHNDPDKGVKVP